MRLAPLLTLALAFSIGCEDGSVLDPPRLPSAGPDVPSGGDVLEPPLVGQGDVEVRWTLEGGNDQARCQELGVTHFEVVTVPDSVRAIVGCGGGSPQILQTHQSFHQLSAGSYELFARAMAAPLADGSLQLNDAVVLVEKRQRIIVGAGDAKLQVLLFDFLEADFQ